MLQREKELKAQVAGPSHSCCYLRCVWRRNACTAERLELKQQLQDIDINRRVQHLYLQEFFGLINYPNRIKRERQRAADMRHAFRAAEERLRCVHSPALQL